MGNLEQVHPGQPSGDEHRVDLLLDIAGQQEALGTKRAKQDDRDVVDRCAAIGGQPRDGGPIRPEDLEPDRVESELVAG